ncbi:MATE family efflux transporter [Ruminococcus sp. OA3]|uniref:MATE family efflux transporter n=1 Tax=Ruminococcus sp. OA3 TaxID=2914164 RepID=UPI001F06627A|nr:MATE family efflux transporter [Ruminococcus sp. OA3]MCH1982546.1 MATE family efflux transporter [Ruminococcus sp. OA3]
MKQTIAHDFKFLSLMKFALPSMIMMVFMSLYTIVDGIFISRLVGSVALSANNIVYPAVNILMAIGIMLATGGSAIIARKLGEKKPGEANENFSMIIVTGVITGIAGLIIGVVFLEQICRVLGATDMQIGYSATYLRVVLFFAPMCMLQMLFQSFFVTAGKPGMGLALTVAAGAANMVLDYLFMGPLGMGVAGAALATGIGQCIPAVTGLLYFLIKKDGLRFVRPKLDFRALRASCLNGSSEMVTNLSAAVVTYLFNIIMLRLASEDGVAAITVVLYGQFLFCALYLGFSIGVAPVFSYNYGAGRRDMLKRIYRICMRFTTVSSVIIGVAAFIGAPMIAQIFVDKGTAVYSLTERGCYLFAFAYLFCGINILASGIFTALSDGRTSALISFLRTFVFIVISVLVLSYFLGTDGVWLSIPLAEILTLTVSLTYLGGFFGNKERRKQKLSTDN